MRETFEVVLQSVEDIAPLVRHFCFTRADGGVFDFIPGQFITLLLEHSGHVLKRSYSLANAPSGSHELQLAAAYVPQGVASTLLFALQPGDTLQASGPFGRLVLPTEPQPRVILVATGTGVTPYRSMLPALAQRMAQQNLQAVLVQGVRTPEELLYGAEFVAFANAQANFRYVACYSKAQLPDAQAHERCGRVHQVFDELALDPQRDLVYLCGNPNMIDDAFALLTAAGFASPRVRREKYISAKS